jgi:hypothetical protein
MRRLEILDYDNLAFGDDIALACDQEFDPNKFELAMQELGMECNKSKQGVTEGDNAYFSFLGYYHFKKSWSQGNKGKFPIMRLASGLVFKERFEDLGGEDSGEITTEQIRLLGYAMKLNVCKEHGDFDILVKTVASHEPTGLPVDKILSAKSMAQYLRVHRTSSATSIENSPVIKILGEIQNLSQDVTRSHSVETPIVVIEPADPSEDYSGLYDLLIAGAPKLMDNYIEGFKVLDQEPINDVHKSDKTLTIKEVSESPRDKSVNPANELRRRGFKIETKIVKIHTSTLPNGKKEFHYVWNFKASRDSLVRGEVNILLGSEGRAVNDNQIVKNAYSILLNKIDII